MAGSWLPPRRSVSRRRKNDAGFSGRALAYCLEAGGVALRDIDYVVFYDKPFLKFERLVETYLAFAPRGFASFRLAMPLWVREKLFQKQLLRDELAQIRGRLRLATTKRYSPSTIRATRRPLSIPLPLSEPLS